MNTETQALFADLLGADATARNRAFMDLIKATDVPVDWAYEVWDKLLGLTKSKDNHLRAIATQLLCNLAKSDPKHRMLKDFDTVMAVTRDSMFVTARHTLQNVWKVAVPGAKQQQIVVDRLAEWFAGCTVHKNCTLIRYDITVGLRNLYDVARDELVKVKALALIETEPDLKYRKKYAGAWKKA